MARASAGLPAVSRFMAHSVPGIARRAVAGIMATTDNPFENEVTRVEIGFCGPGLMGAPMIRQLLRAGHSVHVWNRTRAKAEALQGDGAHVVDTPRELAPRAEAVLLC